MVLLIQFSLVESQRDDWREKPRFWEINLDGHDTNTVTLAPFGHMGLRANLREMEPSFAPPLDIAKAHFWVMKITDRVSSRSVCLHAGSDYEG